MSKARDIADGTRYVDVTGDTMTGALALPSGGLNVGSGQLAVDASGRVLTPYQPAFQASSNEGMVTYSGGSTIPFATAQLNRGNHYNTSTSTFTAPVGGVYYFELVMFNGVNRLAANIAVNGSAVYGGGDLIGYAFQAGSEGEKSISTSLLRTLSANDTVKVITRPGYDAYIYGGHSSFMGYLLG